MIYIRSLRFTFGVTPLPVYNASIAAGLFPRMPVSAEVSIFYYIIITIQTGVLLQLFSNNIKE